MLASLDQVPAVVPKHIFLINIHRSPSVSALSLLLTRSVIDRSLFCLRDRTSPLMSPFSSHIIDRTSPTFASYDARGEALDQIEQSVVRELDAFDGRFFVLYGYNRESHSIESFKQTIHKDAVFTSKCPFLAGVSAREGFTRAFASYTADSPNTFIHYTRISSNHYSIPSTVSVDQCLPLLLLTPRFIGLVQAMPAPSQASSTLVVFSHNITGLLFHLPLLQLICSHLRDDNNSAENYMSSESDMSV